MLKLPKLVCKYMLNTDSTGLNDRSFKNFSMPFNLVRKCSKMSANVQKCPQMSKNVRKCTQMSANARKCPECSQMPKMSAIVQNAANVRKYLKVSANAQKCPQLSLSLSYFNFLFFCCCKYVFM
ncbi:unnamed protein product [Meloidogyne enterolobii]|uniref:Uncharacterized protein n=1 Tax=Meloidogyne enterolobii TaxID=390850 RepID=A0ACB0YN05_MELEN